MTMLEERASRTAACPRIAGPGGGAEHAPAADGGSAHGPGQAATATVLGLVLHARDVPSATREAYADRLAALELGEAAFVLRTCHRVELYLAPGASDLPELPEPPAGTAVLRDVEAVRHLIAVACGIDSAVFGEDQILHQLRTCLAARREAGPLDPVLDRLLQAALRAGRQARTWFSGAPRSLADVALDRIARDAGPLDGRPILVAGVGRMGRLAAFAAARRGARVVATNRSDDRARSLAAEVDGRWLPFGRAAVEGLAGVVVGLAGPWGLEPAEADALAASAAVVVDLSSPQSVPADLAMRLGERFVSVDALAEQPEFDAHDRLRPRLERLVSETGRDYCQWLRTRDAVPVIQAVASSADGLRRAEVEWLLRRLPDLPADDREAVEQMSHRLVAAILHAPLSALRDDATGEREQAARILFGL